MTHQYSSQDDAPEPKEVPLQVDFYGIKTRAGPKPPDEEDPESWLDVWKRVQKSLMRIATEPLALVADVFSATRSIVRGIGDLPSAVSQRIAGAHRRAEAAEMEAHAAQLQGDTVDGEVAFDELQALLMELRARGVSAGLHRLPDGRLSIILVRAEHEELAAKLIAEESEFETVEELSSGGGVHHKRLTSNDP